MNSPDCGHTRARVRENARTHAPMHARRKSTVAGGYCNFAVQGRLLQPTFAGSTSWRGERVHNCFQKLKEIHQQLGLEGGVFRMVSVEQLYKAFGVLADAKDKAGEVRKSKEKKQEK